jgi:hypothetical protein
MRTSLFVAAFLGLLAGCWTMPPYESVDFGKTRDGRLLIKDTPRTWSEMKAQLDRHLGDEKKALRPQGGSPNWNDFWLNTFKTWRDGILENPERYVGYIVQRRRELGLSEIVFPSGETPPTR